MIWIISGTGRKVGKTTLALKLLSILPNSIYAKLGHGKKKFHKPPALFHTYRSLLEFIQVHQRFKTHLIIEANRLLPKAFKPLSIFIDEKFSLRSPRRGSKKLKDNAQIVISKTASVKFWWLFLYKTLGSLDLAKAVSLALFDQKLRVRG